MEKNLKKDMYTHAQLNHFAVHLKLTQHCTSTWREKKKEYCFRQNRTIQINFNAVYVKVILTLSVMSCHPRGQHTTTSKV